MRRASFAALFAAFTLGTVAHADAREDGEAGLHALDQGSFTEAIRLFTRAIKSGNLNAEDREFAYLSRGKAYLGKGDTTDALIDLRQALRLKPDDADAKAALVEATAPRTPPPNNTESPPPSNDPFGLLAQMAGHYYWYDVAGTAPHRMMYHVAWATPGQTLSLTVLGKGTLAQVGEIQFDRMTGKLLLVGVTAGMGGNVVSYGTVEVRPASIVGYGYEKDVPIRSTLTRGADGTYHEHEEHYVDGRWQGAIGLTLTEVSEAEAEAQGFVQAR